MIYYSLVLAALTFLSGTSAATTPEDAVRSTLANPANQTLVIQESPDKLYSAFLPTAEQDSDDRIVSRIIGSSTAQRYCSDKVEGCTMFPEGCVKEKEVTFKAQEGVHGNFTQFTTEIVPEKCGIEPGQYVQYRTNSPPGSKCAGYPFYAEIVDALKQQLCVRCCVRTEDCQLPKDATCEEAMPGNYFAAKTKKSS